VRPTTISKYNTFLQLALVGLTTAAPLVSADMTPALTLLQYVLGPRDLHLSCFPYVWVGSGPARVERKLTVTRYVVAATTVWSGASYVYSKDAVKILK